MDYCKICGNDGYNCQCKYNTLESAIKRIEELEQENQILLNKVLELNPCKGIELPDGYTSGCTASHGDCPNCGK